MQPYENWPFEEMCIGHKAHCWEKDEKVLIVTGVLVDNTRHWKHRVDAKLWDDFQHVLASNKSEYVYFLL